MECINCGTTQDMPIDHTALCHVCYVKIGEYLVDHTIKHDMDRREIKITWNIKDSDTVAWLSVSHDTMTGSLHRRGNGYVIYFNHGKRDQGIGYTTIRYVPYTGVSMFIPAERYSRKDLQAYFDEYRSSEWVFNQLVKVIKVDYLSTVSESE